MQKENVSFRHANGRRAQLEELEERTDISSAEISQYLAASQVYSLEKAGHQSDDSPRGTSLEVAAENSTVDEVHLHLMQESTRALVCKYLPEREQNVITRRYGLDGSPPQTLEEIGNALSLTRERIRQIEGRAMERLLRAAKQTDLDRFL